MLAFFVLFQRCFLIDFKNNSVQSRGGYSWEIQPQGKTILIPEILIPWDFREKVWDAYPEKSRDFQKSLKN